MRFHVALAILIVAAPVGAQEKPTPAAEATPDAGAPPGTNDTTPIADGPQATEPTAAAPPTTGLAAWSTRVLATAATDPGGVASAALTPGLAVEAKLVPRSAMRFAGRPGKLGEADSFAGLFQLRIEQAGRYRIALGAGAWVDVLAGGKALDSSEHAHGAAGSGIAKMVDFALEPGDYVIQISAAPSSTLPMMVVALP